MARDTAASLGCSSSTCTCMSVASDTRRPIRRAAEAVATLAAELVGIGIPLEHVDLGGGLGIAYRLGDSVLSVDDYGSHPPDRVLSRPSARPRTRPLARWTRRHTDHRGRRSEAPPRR